MIKKRILWIIVFSFLIILANCSFISSYTEPTKEGAITSSETEQSEYRGYIIQFKESAITEYNQRLIDGKTHETFFSRIFKTITGQAISEESYKQQLQKTHTKAKQDISRMTGKAIINEFYLVFNGLSADISDEQAKEIEKLPYVKKVYKNYEVKALLDDSIPLINADDVWLLPDPNPWPRPRNLTGVGIKIAIIDTGVDYLHPDLGGCFGQGCKVEGGYDIVNQDNDPMDDHGHGTHCASIAAGTGAASQGQFKGVAPDATLYAYKVLDSGGSGYEDWIIEGIERAVEDNVDVISMSLGGYASPDSPMSQAANNAVGAGVVVSVAVGNLGIPFGIASPGNAEKVISVGASYNDNNIGRKSELEIMLPFKRQFLSKVFDYSATGEISSQILDAGYGYPENFSNQNFDGKIALIKRGPVKLPLTFKEKVQNAVNAGAAGVIIYNYWPNDFSGTLIEYSEIPAISISGKNGEIIKDLMNEYEINAKIKVIEDKNQVSWFSSKGPSDVKEEISNKMISSLYKIKPDVTAPGVKICAAKSSQWNQNSMGPPDYCYDNTYARLSGTSMATPHVAGAAALIKQAHPDWSPDEVKMVLRNTAIDIDEDILTQGYGRIDALAAVITANTLKAEIKEVKISEIFSQPMNISTIPRNFLRIVGDAYGEGFSDYKIIYSEDQNFNNYQEIKFSTSQVFNSTLALWDISSLNGKYYLKLIVNGENSKSEDIEIINVNSNLLWNKDLGLEGGIVAPFVIGDVDNDGKDEIVVRTVSNKIYVFDYKGNLVNGWPVNLNEMGEQTKPALADINKDGKLEIVITINNKIFILSWNGTIINEIEIEDSLFSAPTIADFNEDGNLDIIVGRVNTYWDGARECYLEIFNMNGSHSSFLATQSNDFPSFSSSISVGDIDNDGHIETVMYIQSQMEENGRITIFKNNGSLLSSWIMNEYIYVPFYPPILGDINQDNKLEIITAGERGRFEGEAKIKVRAWNYLGEEVQNWPTISGHPPRTGPLFIDIYSLILTDLNKDNLPEAILAIADSLFVLNADGTINYYSSTQSEWFSIIRKVVSDEAIASGSAEGLYAFDEDLFLIKGWPTLKGLDKWSEVAISDLDKDGFDELIASSSTFIPFIDPDAKIFVFKLDKKARGGEWPMFHHDIYSSGSYNFEPYLCGNGIVENFEECDGINDSKCPNRCQENCWCIESIPKINMLLNVTNKTKISIISEKDIKSETTSTNKTNETDKKIKPGDSVSSIIGKFISINFIGKSIETSISPSINISHSPSEPTSTDLITITASSSLADIQEIRIYINEQLKRTCSFAISKTSPFTTVKAISSVSQTCSYQFYPSSELSKIKSYNYYAIVKTSTSQVKSETKYFTITEMPSISPVSKCNKDDNENIYVKGTCQDSSDIYEDVCTKGQLAEFSCVNDVCVASIISCPEGHICQDGACVKSENNPVAESSKIESYLKTQPTGIIDTIKSFFKITTSAILNIFR